MKIYTKTGDDGQTSLLGGQRVSKYHLRIESYGTVDELNAQLGVLAVMADGLFPLLEKIQHILFNIGSLLAAEDPEKWNLKQVSAAQIEALEKDIDRMNSELPKLKNFILPGGNKYSAQAHVCRTVCRRAERRAVALREEENNISPLIIQYLNRLSDWFFVFARYVVLKEGGREVLWNSEVD